MLKKKYHPFTTQKFFVHPDKLMLKEKLALSAAEGIRTPDFGTGSEALKDKKRKPPPFLK